MKKILLCFSLWLVGFSSSAWADKEYKVVVFGDSLASGYQIQMDDAFPAKMERKIRASGYNLIKVVSLSKPSATTASATQDLDLVKRQLPDVIVIMLGINDVIRRVVPSATYGNLNTIIADLKATGAYVVLVGVNAPPQNGEGYQKEIQSDFYALAKSYGVAFYPSALAGVEGNPTFTMADGIHPNALGVDTMVENIFPLVDLGLRWRYEVYNYEQELQRLQSPSSVLPPP